MLSASVLQVGEFLECQCHLAPGMKTIQQGFEIVRVIRQFTLYALRDQEA
jgi:hypothetical protein